MTNQPVPVARITRALWRALPAGYKAGSAAAGTARMLRYATDKGTTSIPVRVVDRGELVPLGRVVVTPAAQAAADRTGDPAMITKLLDLHRQGDWGSLTAQDLAANDCGLERDGRLLSSNLIGARVVWIVSEADRSVTTVLVPSDL